MSRAQGSAAHHADIRKGDNIVAWDGVHLKDDVQLDWLVGDALVRGKFVTVDLFRRNVNHCRQIVYFTMEVRVRPPQASFIRN